MVARSGRAKKSAYRALAVAMPAGSKSCSSIMSSKLTPAALAAASPPAVIPKFV